MKFRSILTRVIAASLLFTAGSALADEFSSDQQDEIRSVVKDYLLQNPEILIEMSNILQERQEKAEAERTAHVLSKSAKAIFEDPLAPIAGNPDGDVTVVEFFDYNCGYCKRTWPAIRSYLEKDKNIKIVFKEFPILGESSKLAARVALAAHEQGKYFEFHNAMMEQRSRVTEENVMKTAAKIGLDVDRLQKDMKDPSIDEQLSRVSLIARSLDIRGTPAMIVGQEVIKGAVTLEELSDIIRNSRAKS